MEESIGMEKENVFRKVNTSLTKEDIKMMGPLELAYVGDACYELMVRTYLLDRDLPVDSLHKKNVSYVKAEAQADLVHALEGVLNEKEKRLIKRGRNTKSHSNPKGASLADYKYSTGFEALFGYLYLTSQNERLEELFSYIIEYKTKNDGR